MRVTDEQLREWKALADAATPGPWKRVMGDYMEGGPVYGVAIRTDDGDSIAEWDDLPLSPEDAAFVASARAAVPALVAEVQMLRSILGDALLTFRAQGLGDVASVLEARLAANGAKP